MKIELCTGHNLEKEVVKQRLLAETSIAQEKYKNELKNLNVSWDDYKFNMNFSVMGIKFLGYGEILENKLLSNLELSGAAKLFYNKIKIALENKLKQILE